MIRSILAVGALTGLVACGGGEFLFPGEGGGGGGGETPVTNGATTTYSGEVNRLTYDADADQVVVNNLPFDGPEGTYTRVAARTELDGFGVYRSLQTSDTGQRRYYAVFRQTANGSAAAVATGDYNGFGFGGTALTRSNATTTMPRTGEYVYTGLYAGARTFSDRGGIELVEGDVLLEVDIDDFDTTGAVEGRVTNRTAYNIDGVPVQPLPTIVFTTTSIDTATAAIAEGTASTRSPTGTARDTGTYQGLFVGENGQEIVGRVSITGNFYAYRIIETFQTTDASGNVTEQQRQLSYAEYLALQSSGDADRLANVAITEEAQTFQVREQGVFTAAD